MKGRVYDISVKLGVEDINYPGTPPYSRDLISRLADGDASNLSKLVMSTHSGTHLDAPSHFIQEGLNIDDYPARTFILPAHVVTVEARMVIVPENLADLDTTPGDAVLFQTDNSRSGRATNGEFTEDFVHLSLEAAYICVARKLGLVGIDYNTIEPLRAENYPVHRKLLGNGILILESINLADVPAGKYTLICLPLKMKGAEASPVRAVIVES